MKYCQALYGILLVCFGYHAAPAQVRRANDTLVSYARIIEAGDNAADSGNYARALGLYQQVPEGDTNYAAALYKAVFVANNDSTLYAGGLPLARRGAALPFSMLHQNSLLQLANSYQLNGYADSANIIYRQLEAASPHTYLFLLERGRVCLRQKRYAEGLHFLEEALLRDPLQGSTHQSLAVAYLHQRRPSEAYLALISSLFFTSDPAAAGRAITLLSAIARSNLDELSPASKPATAEHPLWDETDELLLSRLPLSPDYQFKGTLNEDPLVKVLHALLEKMPATIKATDTNLAMQVYVPLFQKLYAGGNFNELVQYTFSGYGIEGIEKAASRNKRAMDEVRDETVAYFTRILETGTKIFAARAKAPLIRYRFLNEGEEVVMTGNLLSTNPDKWGAGEMKIYTWGNLIASGPTDAAGEKTGTWNFYYKSGQLRRTGQFAAGMETGTAQTYSPTGVRSQTTRLKNDTAYYEENYDAAGRLKRIATQEYARGKSRSRQIQFHPNGTPMDTAFYIDEERADGPARQWDDWGKMVEEGTYRKGKLQGFFRRWYPFTHVLKSEGTLEDELLTGTFTRFHPNGKPALRGTYRKGNQNGWEEEWNAAGIMQERNLYEDGKLQETQYLDESGQLYERVTFSKGQVQQLARRDAGGKMQPVISFKNKGKEVLRLTHANGRPKSEIPYVDGKPQGRLQFFAPSGLPLSEAEYAAGEPQGWKMEYYPNGRVKSERYQWEGKAGRYRRFSESGTIEQESFLTPDNTTEGPVTTFSTFGKPLYTLYRNNDLLDGPYTEHDPEGHTLVTYHYNNDLLLGHQSHDTTGKVWAEERFKAGNGILQNASLDKGIVSRDTLAGGRRQGIVQAFFAPGIPLRKVQYVNGLIEGPLTTWHPNGQMAMHDTERHSNTEGLRQNWDEAGNLTSEATYVEDVQNGPEWRYNAGTVRSFRYLKGGLFDGPYFFMNGTADTLARLDYTDGHLLRKQVRDSGGRWMAPQDVEGGSADVVTYYANGTKAVDFHYRHNALEGEQRSWYPNGKVAEQMTYKKGGLEGELKRFYADGTPYLQSRFENNNYEGDEIVWYPNGKMCSRIAFTKDLRHGPATYYDKNGKAAPVTIMYRYDRIVGKR